MVGRRGSRPDVLLALRRGVALALCSLLARVTLAGRHGRSFSRDDAHGITEPLGVFANLRARPAHRLRVRDDVLRRQKRGGRTRDEMLSDRRGQIATTLWAEVAVATKEVGELRGLERASTTSAMGDRMVPAGLKQERALTRRQHAL